MASSSDDPGTVGRRGGNSPELLNQLFQGSVQPCRKTISLSCASARHQAIPVPRGSREGKLILDSHPQSNLAGDARTVVAISTVMLRIDTSSHGGTQLF